MEVKLNRVDLQEASSISPPTWKIVSGLSKLPSEYFYFGKQARLLCVGQKAVRLLSGIDLEELDGINNWIEDIGTKDPELIHPGENTQRQAHDPTSALK